MNTTRSLGKAINWIKRHMYLVIILALTHELCFVFGYITSAKIDKVDYSSYDTQLMEPHGDLLSSSISPDGKHRVDVYIDNTAGATVSISTDIYVFAIDDGFRFNDLKSWRVYYSYPNNNLDVRWVDNDTIRVHDVQLDMEQIDLSIYQDSAYTRSGILYFDQEKT